MITDKILLKALQAYNIAAESTIEPLAGGLINATYKITSPQADEYILQKINDDVFHNPTAIEENIQLISAHLKNINPDYLFTSPLSLMDGKQMLHIKNKGYYRMFSFVKNSITYHALTSPQQAFEAAAAFAKFTKLLSGFNVHSLQHTIPNFHNLKLRYHQFEKSLHHGNKERIALCKNEIDYLLQHKHFVEKFEEIKESNYFKLRVTHHDTKISNVLFNKNEKAICIIDLDTVMPGYFISDVGDMMRTYVCPVNEEETDCSKIIIRKKYYDAVVEGYLSQMNDELNDYEKQQIHFAGAFAIYMQALRFLTDYFNNDIYYGSKYQHQNFNRAKNQIALLQQYEMHIK